MKNNNNHHQSMICTVHKISKFAFGEKSAKIPTYFSGSRTVSLLWHGVPVAILHLSLPCSSSIAELICTYPSEEVNWHYILKEIRWDQVFQRAWCVYQGVKKPANFCEGLNPAASEHLAMESPRRCCIIQENFAKLIFTAMLKKQLSLFHIAAEPLKMCFKLQNCSTTHGSAL